MGSFNESCGFSGLPITYKAKVRMMAIRYIGGRENNRMTSALKLFEPVSLLVRGKYNDYGWIDFDKGEEERFFSSVESMGINLVRRSNGASGVEMPANIFLWFILEDAFQLADEMPVEWYLSDEGFKVVPIRELRAAALGPWRELREVEIDHFAKVMAQTADDGSYDRQHQANEKTKNHLSNDRYNLRTTLMVKARAKDPAVAERALMDLFDLERLSLALDAIRRPLAPVISGDQGYDDAAQKLLAGFVTGSKRRN